MDDTDPSDLVDRILDHLELILPARRPVSLHEPTIEADAWAKVRDCLESGWVSSVGAEVDAFEEGLADYTGVGHAVATVNGTAALHICALLAGVGPGDEVLLPALTFVGTANPLAAMGAVPHFVDSDPVTLGVDPVALEEHLEATTEQGDGVCVNTRTGRPIRALIVVHVLGHIADMPALRTIADAHHLALIEDAAEAMGSFRDGRHAGHWGDLTALSFNGNKIITTGGGGAVLTSRTEQARKARHLTTTAKLEHPWAFEHDCVAFNYRLPNLNAALGVAQMEKLPELLAAKRRLAESFRGAFSEMIGLDWFDEPTGCRSNLWLNLLLLPDHEHRNALLIAAHERGLLLRPFWTPLHRLPMYEAMPRAALPVAEELFDRGVCLPSSAGLFAAAESTT